jgi:hypothetical protein
MKPEAEYAAGREPLANRLEELDGKEVADACDPGLEGSEMTTS